MSYLVPLNGSLMVVIVRLPEEIMARPGNAGSSLHNGVPMLDRVSRLSGLERRVLTF